MKEAIRTEKAPTPRGPYSQAILANGFIYVAGQIPLGLDGVLVPGEIETQTRVVLQNVSAILQAAGSDLRRVVKTTVFLTDLTNFSRMNAVYAEFFTNEPPARSTVQVGLVAGVLIEIECVALA